MEKLSINDVTNLITHTEDSALREPDVEPPIVFALGKPPPNSAYRKSHSVRGSLGKSPSTKPTDTLLAHPITKPKPKPRPYSGTKFNKKLAVPISRSVPLAFPAASTFTFSIPSSSVASTVSDFSIKVPTRSIQVLPTDVLVLVVEATHLKHHRHLLRAISLVNRALNIAIAPVLYRKFRLPSLPDVYEFSLGPRHPTCVVSLEIFTTPDPQRREWSPPDPAWANRLMETLGRLERLMFLSVNCCENDEVLRSLTKCALDLRFLPLLQKLSFGPWHQLSSLGVGRPVTSYGLAFTVQMMRDNDQLKRLLAKIALSTEVVRELRITLNTPTHDGALPMAYRRDVLALIGEHLPDLRVLNIRFSCKSSVIDQSIRLSEIVRLIPASLSQLTSLEIFDLRFPQFSSGQVIKAAVALSEQGGTCPHLQFVNFDGVLWKRARKSLVSVPPTAPLSLEPLSLQGNGDTSQTQPSTTRTLAPELGWTPSPSSKLGRRWWEQRVRDLGASSQSQAVCLLRQWMAEYWDEETMQQVVSLDRTVIRW